ncbi:hypothetical protein [Paraburkholderia haematera]|uniref:Uncharacterized protein n=1 Tax=Paraburkholderia haematera TaxID=2793077 RepID=A0ABM8RIJ7_9BURK|nr:hypothetical protein [Paraburkholderia haematera]CAE6754681.1 hypothetical protein R69888_03126 [Paraburkholderia haematera]
MNASNPIDYQVPPGWGDDPLSEFQWAGMKNEFASFVHAPGWRNALSAIAEDLSKCSAYAISGAFEVDDPAAGFLFMTAHNHFLASARLVSSGQCLSAYATGRAAVESALYGWYLAGKPDACQRWHDKPKTRGERKKWDQEFRFSALSDALSMISEDASKWAKEMHQTAIDFGAHPNKEALYSNMRLETTMEGRRLTMEFLHTSRAASLSATKFVIETGMFVVTLFGRAYPDADRFHGLVKAASRHAEALRALVAEYAQVVKDDVQGLSAPHDGIP